MVKFGDTTFVQFLIINRKTDYIFKYSYKQLELNKNISNSTILFPEIECNIHTKNTCNLNSSMTIELYAILSYKLI